MNGLFNTLATTPQYNGVTFEDLYPTVRGMSPWQRTLLVNEFLRDASQLAFALELQLRIEEGRFSESTDDDE